MFKGEKSYRLYWILFAIVVVYSATIAFLPWLGHDPGEDMVKMSSYGIIGFAIIGVLFLMIYIRNNLRISTPIHVDQEQVLPHKLAYLKKPVGAGRKPIIRPQIQKYDRWEDESCRQTFVKDICTSCIHYRRRYYGNFCKHFGMVVDRPTQAAK